LEATPIGKRKPNTEAKGLSAGFRGRSDRAHSRFYIPVFKLVLCQADRGDWNGEYGCSGFSKLSNLDEVDFENKVKGQRLNTQ
jgi:hypothetical protein